MEGVKLYQDGNPWQRNRYAFMSEYNRKAGIKEFGVPKGGRNPYYHLITQKDTLHNFLNEPDILEAVTKRFNHHKAGDRLRVFTNTVASQPCCFNLFVPLQNDKALAGKVFSRLLDKVVTIDDLIIEFTPQKEDGYDETLGDQSRYGGTDSDVAVFYSSTGKKGVILIEFKYIESKFSVCSSFKAKKKLKAICSHPGFYSKLIEPELEKNPASPDCGYLRYYNWQLTKKSNAIDLNKVKEHHGCPFRYSYQQLWRNMLLAENVAKHRGLDEFHFWVISPAQNKYLWTENGEEVEYSFRSILTSEGNSAFRKLNLQNDFFELLKSVENNNWTKEWLRKFDERYLTNTTV